MRMVELADDERQKIKRLAQKNYGFDLWIRFTSNEARRKFFVKFHLKLHFFYDQSETLVVAIKYLAIFK